MLMALAVILAIAWLLGFSVFNVASAAIHVLIVLAVVALIVHFVKGRRGLP
jgi:lipoprotein signal peptidase